MEGECVANLRSKEDLPDIAMIKESTLREIHQEIRQLQEPYAEILLLRITMDLSFKELGDIYEKSENWARVTYYRAKCKLAERVNLDEL